MSKILADVTVEHYAQHVAKKYSELSTEREIIEALIESHEAQSARIKSLEESCREQFVAIENLAFALAKETPKVLEDVCGTDTYLSWLKERGVFSWSKTDL
jgi:hypothetical protein